LYISKYAPELSKISNFTPRTFHKFNFALQTSFLHIFTTVTPNQVILVPKFSESHHLSPQAIYILMIVAFLWLYAWAFGEFVLRLMNKNNKTKYMRISKMKYTRPPVFSFQTNEASVLEHIAPT
jgi:H+/Cl- antiporter ClcA